MCIRDSHHTAQNLELAADVSAVDNAVPTSAVKHDANINAVFLAVLAEHLLKVA